MQADPAVVAIANTCACIEELAVSWQLQDKEDRALSTFIQCATCSNTT